MLHGVGNNAIASFIMRLSCPECRTEYEVPDAALTGRPRTLRCATCGTKWQTPALEAVSAEPADAAAAEVQAEPVIGAAVAIERPADVEPEVAVHDAATAEPAEAELPQEPVTFLRPPQNSEKRKQPEPASRTALKISVLLVIAIVVAVLLAHRPIMQAWPPSIRLFNALGLN